MDPVKNFAITTVATAPSPANSGTSLIVASGAGALFPDPSTDGNFNVIIFPQGEQPTMLNAEIVRVDAISGDTFTINRGQEGTSYRSILEGDIVMLGFTKKSYDEIKAHIADTNNPHSVTATQVGLSNVTNDAQIPLSQKGAASGVAELGEDGLVPTAQLPSYVDDVLEYANTTGFPETGETGKIYVALDTNKTYRWSGSAYVEISASLALGETSGTAYRGDRGKTAYDHSQLTTGNPHGVTAADIGVEAGADVTDEGNVGSSINGAAAVTTLNDADKLGVIVSGVLKTITAANIAIEVGKRQSPVGTVYTNGSVSTNPATLLGFGTWAAFGAGRVTVGYLNGDADFGTLGATGGEKTHVLSVGELATHTHTQNAHTHTQNAHNHGSTGYISSDHTHQTHVDWSMRSGTGGYGYFTGAAADARGNATTGVSANHTHSVGDATATNQNTTATNQNTGSNTAHNNLQPFVVAYEWIRSA